MINSNFLTDLAVRIEAEHIAAGEAAASHLGHAMACGDLLIEAKAELKHGQWLPWLLERGIADRTARRYMRLARNRPEIEAKSATVADLTLRGAIEMLGVKTTPDDAEGLNLGELGAGEMWLPIDAVIYRAGVPYRTANDADWIDHLATILDVVPGIEVNQRNELIDGRYRLLAAKQVGAQVIRAFVTESRNFDSSRLRPGSAETTDLDLLDHIVKFVERNSRHGMSPLTLKPEILQGAITAKSTSD